jgi:hypothetical protein
MLLHRRAGFFFRFPTHGCTPDRSGSGARGNSVDGGIMPCVSIGARSGLPGVGLSVMGGVAPEVSGRPLGWEAEPATTRRV